MASGEGDENRGCVEPEFEVRGVPVGVAFMAIVGAVVVLSAWVGSGTEEVYPVRAGG